MKKLFAIITLSSLLLAQTQVQAGFFDNNTVQSLTARSSAYLRSGYAVLTNKYLLGTLGLAVMASVLFKAYSHYKPSFVQGPRKQNQDPHKQNIDQFLSTVNSLEEQEDCATSFPHNDASYTVALAAGCTRKEKLWNNDEFGEHSHRIHYRYSVVVKDATKKYNRSTFERSIFESNLVLTNQDNKDQIAQHILQAIDTCHTTLMESHRNISTNDSSVS